MKEGAMPKQTIQTETADSPALAVHWTKAAEHRGEGLVQLSLRVDGNYLDRWADAYYNGDEPIDGDTHASIFTEVLSVGELDDLIRTLRRARRGAFGA